MQATPAVRPFGYLPEGITAFELRAGDVAVFDPFYGAETVEGATEMKLPNGVVCVHLYVRSLAFGSRFIVRAEHEAVTRWNPAQSEQT